MTALALGERLDLSQASPLADQLRQAEVGDVLLDASAVSHLGGLCLQVLLAARQMCQRQGRNLAILSPSEAFCQSLADFGLPDDIFPSKGDRA